MFSCGAAQRQSRFTSGSLAEHTEGFSGRRKALRIYQTLYISDHYAVYWGIHITCVGSEERRHSTVRLVTAFFDAILEQITFVDAILEQMTFSCFRIL